MVRAMETIATTQQLPGRLGDPEMSLGTDPRADARLIAGMAPYGMHPNAPASAITPSSSYEERLAITAATEAALQDFFPILYAGLPEVAGVARSVETIDGVDGNAITLYIHRPAAATGDVPAILHLHGGGMALLAAADEQFVRWRDELAAPRCRGRRCRVPQLGRGARATSVPGRARRLHVGTAVAAHSPRRARRVEDRGVG